MGKGSRKFTGFLWALIIAIVSFFIIFIFFPDVSNKFFGVSMKEPKKVGETVTNAVNGAVDTAVETVTDVVKDTVSDVVKDSFK